MAISSFRLPSLSFVSIRAAVRDVARRGSSASRAALYSAAAGSGLLARAIAEEYPFTFCPKAGCVGPIAHGGDCVVEAP